MPQYKERKRCSTSGNLPILTFKYHAILLPPQSGESLINIGIDVGEFDSILCVHTHTPNRTEQNRTLGVTQN
jgi:hypothetical protein